MASSIDDLDDDGPRPVYPPIEDRDIDGCRAMLLASIERTIHDACGATCNGQDVVQRLFLARSAHRWLHLGDMHKADRWRMCELVGLDPEIFDEHIRKAEIPWPTEETLAASWSLLELTYWKLAGRIGEQPQPRPLRVGPRKRNRKDRSAMPNRYVRGELGRCGQFNFLNVLAAAA